MNDFPARAQGRREPTTGELAVALLESMGCQNCLGSGIHVAYRIAKPPCPTCGGSGVVLPDEMVEAAALPIHNKSPKCYESFGDIEDGCRCVEKAQAALVAGLREIAE